MPTLNEFHEEYQDKGVTLIALSQEGKGVVHRFVDDHDIRYPVAIDSGGKTFRAYGVRGVPDALVIDADGTIAWRGHPGNKAAMIEAVEEALKSATFLPIPDDPHPRLESAYEKASEGKLGEACKIASRHEDDAGDPELAEAAGDLVADVDMLVEKQLARAEKRVKAGAYHDAVSSLRKLAPRLKGCDHQDAIEDRIETIEKDPNAQDDLEAGEDLEKILRKMGSAKPAAIASKLRSIIKEYPDTVVSDRAQALLSSL